MAYIGLFFAGAFLCNSLPHLTTGLEGVPFPTPFARPSGVGNSPPLVNFFWGAFNLAAGLALLAHHPLALGPNPDSAAIAAGALLVGAFDAHHFGKVRAGRS